MFWGQLRACVCAECFKLKFITMLSEQIDSGRNWGSQRSNQLGRWPSWGLHAGSEPPAQLLHLKAHPAPHDISGPAWSMQGADYLFFPRGNTVFKLTLCFQQGSQAGPGPIIWSGGKQQSCFQFVSCEVLT